MNDNANASAYPRTGYTPQTRSIAESETYSTRPEVGLTKRELFAAMAMQGWLSVGASVNRQDGMTEDIRGSDTRHANLTAVASVIYADALLAELEKEKP